ncbi:MAG: hypothetical protein N4A40_06535 [Tissierellales bacterium]|jgi:nitrogen regulatory protein PII|nr:hypothetical protein [Tissierellales bacterium]
MYAIFLILNDIYLVDEVHEIFYECKVGATTLDSVGLGRTLLKHQLDVVMFSSIKRILEGDRPYSKTMISVVREKEKLDKVVKRLKEFFSEFGADGLAFMFVTPVHGCYGFKIEETEKK